MRSLSFTYGHRSTFLRVLLLLPNPLLLGTQVHRLRTPILPLRGWRDAACRCVTIRVLKSGSVQFCTTIMHVGASSSQWKHGFHSQWMLQPLLCTGIPYVLLCELAPEVENCIHQLLASWFHTVVHENVNLKMLTFQIPVVQKALAQIFNVVESSRFHVIYWHYLLNNTDHLYLCMFKQLQGTTCPSDTWRAVWFIIGLLCVFLRRHLLLKWHPSVMFRYKYVARCLGVRRRGVHMCPCELVGACGCVGVCVGEVRACMRKRMWLCVCVGVCVCRCLCLFSVCVGVGTGYFSCRIGCPNYTSRVDDAGMVFAGVPTCDPAPWRAFLFSSSNDASVVQSETRCVVWCLLCQSLRIQISMRSPWDDQWVKTRRAQWESPCRTAKWKLNCMLCQFWLHSAQHIASDWFCDRELSIESFNHDLCGSAYFAWSVLTLATSEIENSNCQGPQVGTMRKCDVPG